MPVTYPISELFAWIVDDPSEQHGIVAIKVMGVPMQAVTSKRALAERMKPDIESVTAFTGRPVKLQRFVLAETIEVVP